MIFVLILHIPVEMRRFALSSRPIPKYGSHPNAVMVLIEVGFV